VYLWFITIGAAILGEAFCLRLQGRQATPVLLDGSAILTGWQLAVSLPPWAPWWIGGVGGLFATVLGKQVFGGLGQNLFNPAIVARVALLISFPLQMTAWVAPLPLFSPGAPGLIEGLRITLNGVPAAYDAVASASLLGFTKTELSRGVDLLASLLQAPAPGWSGSHPGSMGETAAWLIAAGGLAAQKVGVFGKLVKLDAPLRPGDRVEIYRPITCDPQTLPRRDGAGGDEDE
jgi:Na+-translocating ferredoxin:NAD+ oxidoreductase RnfD subunit